MLRGKRVPVYLGMASGVGIKIFNKGLNRDSINDKASHEHLKNGVTNISTLDLDCAFKSVLIKGLILYN